MPQNDREAPPNGTWNACFWVRDWWGKRRERIYHAPWCDGTCGLRGEA